MRKVLRKQWSLFSFSLHVIKDKIPVFVLDDYIIYKFNFKLIIVDTNSYSAMLNV